MSWFKKSNKQKEQDQRKKDLVNQALASQQALESAATSTMNLAQDVTYTLQAKIDDYASQIDSITRLLTDALLIVDEDGIITNYNPAAALIFGWTKKELIGKSLLLLFKFKGEQPIIDSAFMDRFCVMVNEESLVMNSVHYEDFQGICKNGANIYVDISASKLIRSDKKSYYIILVRDVTSRVQNAQRLAELAVKNQELVTTINASDTGMVILEPNGKEFTVVFTNTGFEKMTGMTRQEILDANIIELLEDDGGQFAVRRCLIDEFHCRHEVKITQSSGGKINADVSITPVFKDRVLQQWILVFYDTTELTLASEELRSSEQRFRAFAETSSEAFLIHNGNSILDWNSHLSKLTEYTDGEINSLAPLDLVHPLERSNVRPLIHETDMSQFETLLVTKSGDVRWVAVNSRPINWDGQNACIVVMRDITPYRTVENQLNTMRERYRSVVDNTIDLVCCFDPNFRITFTNQTFRDYFDFELEDLTGFSLLDVIPEEDHLKFIDYMHSITPEVDVRRGVHRVQRGIEFRWQDWIDRGIFDDAGNLLEYQSVCRDITHLMMAKKQDV